MEVIFTVLSVLNYYTHAIHSILFNVDLQKHVSIFHSMGKKQLFTAGISSNVKNNILVKLSYFLSRRYVNEGNRPAHALSIDDIKKVVQLMKTMQRHTLFFCLDIFLE